MVGENTCFKLDPKTTSLRGRVVYSTDCWINSYVARILYGEMSIFIRLLRSGLISWFLGLCYCQTAHPTQTIRTFSLCHWWDERGGGHHDLLISLFKAGDEEEWTRHREIFKRQARLRGCGSIAGASPTMSGACGVFEHMRLCVQHIMWL